MKYFNKKIVSISLMIGLIGAIYYFNPYKVNERVMCQLRDGKSCYTLSLLYRNNNMSEEDIKKKINYLKKGCKYNDMDSCNFLGFIYANNMIDGIKSDFRKSMNYYKKSCNLNNGASCYSLGVIHEKGEIVEKDISKAIKLYRKGCNLQNGLSCNILGDFYKEGNYLEKDISKAMKFYKKSCKYYPSGCILGYIYEDDFTNFSQPDFYFYTYQDINKKDNFEAVKYYKQTCDAIWKFFNERSFSLRSTPCNNLGVHYERGTGVKQSLFKAKEYYGKACDMGSKKGCENYRRLN